MGGGGGAGICEKVCVSEDVRVCAREGVCTRRWGYV